MRYTGLGVPAHARIAFFHAGPAVIIVTILLNLSLGGCGEHEAVESGVEVPTPLTTLASATAEDTMRVLISRQRELFAAMLSGDRASVLRLLDVRIAGDPAFVTRVPMRPKSRPEHIEVKAGCSIPGSGGRLRARGPEPGA